MEMLLDKTINFSELIENFLKIIEGLDAKTKVAIISRISDSILKEPSIKEDSLFWSSYGGWDKDESSEDIIKDIYDSRISPDREVDF